MSFRPLNQRTPFGAVTAEFAATIAMLLPILLAFVFSCYELAMACMIYNALNHSAHVAAMALSKAYGGDASYATSQTKQMAVLSSIKFANMVVSPEQFTVQFPQNPAQASWTDTTGNVPSVTVTCKYVGGQYGLPPFPNPDPLHLGRLFSLQAKATAYLEGF